MGLLHNKGVPASISWRDTEDTIRRRKEKRRAEAADRKREQKREAMRQKRKAERKARR